MKFLVLLAVITSILLRSAHGAEPAPVDSQIEALFNFTGNLLELKLAADALVSRNDTAEAGRKSVRTLEDDIFRMSSAHQTSQEKLNLLRRFLYESGPWNGNRPFSYDMRDLRGRNFDNKLLVHYVETRRGNCISMPVLVTILGRHIGLKLNLALAPFHVFVKYTDDDGKIWNLEATSGLGLTRDVWIRKQLPMTDEAIAQGIYLKPLSSVGEAALMATLVIERAMLDDKPERAIAIANVILRHDPRNTTALIWRGTAFGRMFNRTVAQFAGSSFQVSPEISAYAKALYTSNQMDFAAAEALGWTERDGIPK